MESQNFSKGFSWVTAVENWTEHSLSAWTVVVAINENAH